MCDGEPLGCPLKRRGGVQSRRQYASRVRRNGRIIRVRLCRCVVRQWLEHEGRHKKAATGQRWSRREDVDCGFLICFRILTKLPSLVMPASPGLMTREVV